MQRAKREKASREYAASACINDLNFNNFSNSLGAELIVIEDYYKRAQVRASTAHIERYVCVYKLSAASEICKQSESKIER